MPTKVCSRKKKTMLLIGMLIGMEEVLRQTELTSKRNLLNKHVFVIPIFFCVAAIIVMTTLSGIVEGRVCL